jgi:hypothetical protein
MHEGQESEVKYVELLKQAIAELPEGIKLTQFFVTEETI